MIHSFTKGGRNLCLDVGSGALHLLDDLGKKVVPFYPGENADDIVRRLQGEYSREEVSACLAELDALSTVGMWNTPLTEEPLPSDDGLVKALCLHVAHDCNLRCGYCFASTGGFDGIRSLMDPTVGKRALDFLMEHSGDRHHLEVDFFGGEPMMNYPAVKEMVAYGRKLERRWGKEIAFTLTTNCYDVPADAIGFLNGEMENLVLSIDGRKEVHDSMRPVVGGDGSYDRALENARRIVANRGEGEYYVRGTFTRKNLDFHKDVLALLDAGFSYVSVEPVVLEEGHALGIREEDLPQIQAEYDRLLGVLLRRKAKGLSSHFFHFQVDLSGGPCLRKRLSGCGCGREYMAVTPQGDLYPCHQFVGREEWQLGNILDGEVREEKRTLFLRNNVREKQACMDCWAQYLCAGGCAANAQAYSGSILEPNPLECQLLRMRMECALAFSAEGMLAENA
ncbi:thioether cross-link-forming SCIFF peptide maturase [Eubacteriales bacterium OttesenSCG-928-M02]|nr:thioether cross-link-forming SCIFF peptide maturase [Eubacteriales bacterium OttesenSCG-928-M02]